MVSPSTVLLWMITGVIAGSCVALIAGQWNRITISAILGALGVAICGIGMPLFGIVENVEMSIGSYLLIGVGAILPAIFANLD